MAIIQMKPKAKMSKTLAANVKKAGGHSKYRATLGYLPSGYHANPKKFASTLIASQKKRVRGMNKTMNSVTFKRVYGFSKK